MYQIANRTSDQILRLLANKSERPFIRLLSGLNKPLRDGDSQTSETRKFQEAPVPKGASRHTEDDIGFYQRALKSFNNDDNQVPLMKWLQSDIDVSPSAIKKWWKRQQMNKEMILQAYIPERNNVLGNELAAAHLIVYNGGSVRFFNDSEWKNKDVSKLPATYDPSKVIQAIDCSNMTLYFGALVNLKQLKQVEWVSFNGLEQVDDWFLDRLSNTFSNSLKYLDLRNCENYTERGLGALYKLEKLETLLIDMQLQSSFEMTCLLLQEFNPHLVIETDR